MNTTSLNKQELIEGLKQAMLELFQEQPDLITEIITESLEEIGLAKAINQERKNDFVSEEVIREILKNKNEDPF
jgi:hypothetical protein